MGARDKRQDRGARHASNLALAAVLSFSTTLPAQQANKPFDQKLTEDQSILHALDSLTFGPRPGIEAVKNMGLKQWIDFQLHPERIPADEALETLANSFVEPSTPTGVFVLVSKVQAQLQAQGRLSLRLQGRLWSTTEL